MVEQGDIFFVVRRKVGASRVAGTFDLQRFYLVLAAQAPAHRFRVFVVGRKQLPAAGAERNWAFNARTTDDVADLGEELGGKVYATKTRGLRRLPRAELAGAGAYRIVQGSDRHSELIYALDRPEHLGALQRELRIEREGRLIIAVRNPDLGLLAAPGRRAEAPAFPEDLRARFGRHRWLPIDDARWLDYEQAQLILIGARGQPPDGSHLEPGEPQTRRELEHMLGGFVRRNLAHEPPERPELKLICPMCAEGFPNRSTYERHLLGAHPARAPSAADLARALKGVHFPVGKEELLRRADVRVAELIRELPERIYRGVTEVATALGEAKSRPL